jgi:hypothetical protein
MAEHPGNRSENIRDLLTAYELGLLDEADRARIEAALADDPALLDELSDDAPEALMLTSDPGRYAEAARAGLREAGAAGPSWADRLRSLWRPRVVLPAVATALAVLAVVLAPGGGASLADLAVVEPMTVVRPAVRADEPAADMLMRAALDNYAAAAWPAAADGFQQALSAGGDQWRRAAQARLYLGTALLMAGDAPAAIDPLRAATGSALTPVREQAEWHLAQALLLTGDADGAADLLAGLRDSPALGDRAAEQWRRLTAR